MGENWRLQKLDGDSMWIPSHPSKTCGRRWPLCQPSLTRRQIPRHRRPVAMRLAMGIGVAGIIIFPHYMVITWLLHDYYMVNNG